MLHIARMLSETRYRALPGGLKAVAGLCSFDSAMRVLRVFSLSGDPGFPSPMRKDPIEDAPHFDSTGLITLGASREPAGNERA